MKGYDEDPEAARKAIDADGWLHTGDLATMRPDGYFRITGRGKEMIETFIRAKWKSSFIRTPKSWKCRLSACPTPSMEKSCWPGSA